jgi:hypothetical protein
MEQGHQGEDCPSHRRKCFAVHGSDYANFWDGPGQWFNNVFVGSICHRTKSREEKHHLFLVLTSWLLGSAKFACLQRQKPAMFAQKPLSVYRHFTGAVCTTSSDGRFVGAFSLASGLSNSPDMVRSPTSRSRWSPVQRAQFKTFCRESLRAWHAPGRRLEPNARLCVAVAQVVLRSKVKAGCVAIEVKRQKTSTSSVSVREPPSPAQAGLFFGALLTPRGDVFAFKGATCPSTGSVTATTIKSRSLSSLSFTHSCSYACQPC